MKKEKIYWLNLSIQQRLIAYFLLAILIPTIFIAAFQYYRATKRIQTELNQFAQQNLSNAENTIDLKMSLLNDLITNSNTSLQKVFSRQPPTTLEGSIHEISEIEEVLTSYFSASNHRSAGAGVTARAFLENRDSYELVRYNPKISLVHNTRKISQNSWFSTLGNTFTIIGFTKRGNTREKPTIEIARRLFDTQNNIDSVSNAAIMLLEIDSSIFTDLLKPYCSTPNSNLYITDQDNLIIAATDKKSVGTSFPAATKRTNRGTLTFLTMAEQPFLVNSKTLPTYGWKIYSCTPMSEISGELEAADSIYILIVVVCMLFALSTAIILSKHISKPIRQLASSMEQVPTEHGLQLTIDYKRKDEFGFLIIKYKEMIQEIQGLIEKLYISNLHKKDAQLKAKNAELATLQARINPHFLYNALDSIHIYALKHQVPKISDMVMSLADFYRFSLSKGKDIITIDDELKIAHSYIALQQARYGNTIQYTVDIPPAIRRCLIVKFTLQPLIENAIEHALSQMATDGNIRITGHQQEHAIFIEIQDNGICADAAKINDILKSVADLQTSFGIRNVNERIQNYFGKHYGLYYFQNENKELTVQIQLPIFHTPGGYYAKNDTC